MKVSELIGIDLDRWVAKAEGLLPNTETGVCIVYFNHHGDGNEGPTFYEPSLKWGQAGPIIERHRIGLYQCSEWIRDIDKSNGVPYKITVRPPEIIEWSAALDGCPDYGRLDFEDSYHGPTPLVAAMRAYVASKYGDEVPEE